MKSPTASSRRDFLKTSTLSIAAGLLAADSAPSAFASHYKAPLSAHMWVYASKYPPDWDATPDLENIFSDLSYAGFAGVEVMDSILRPDGNVEHMQKLVEKYQLPVSGASYQNPMWDAGKYDELLADATKVITRLGQLNGKTFGISVGDARHMKTDAEFDAQARLLKEIMRLCADHGIVPNLHNHIYEVKDDLHDLKGTLARIPDIKLGPDLNWLIRAGVDPVWFIKTYGHQMVYMHIRDQYKDGTWTEYVGQGVTDFPAIAAALRSVNFHGRAAVELAYPKDFVAKNPLREDWKLSHDYVIKTFGW